MDGNWLWGKQIRGTGFDEGTYVYIAPAGNIYCGGNFKSSRIYLSATDSLDIFDPTYQNIFFASYDAGGVIQSKFRNGNFSTEYYLAAFAVNAANEIVATGHLVQSTVNYFLFRKYNAAGGIL